MNNKYNYYGLTDIGKAREINEDTFDGIIHKDVLFLIVADGLGGKEGLPYASTIALNEMRRYIKKHFVDGTPKELKKLIENGMYLINRVLLSYRRAEDSLYGGFGTTFTICAINKNKDIVIGHAGNTRLYIFRDGKAVPMTKDHTESQRLFDKGEIKKEELVNHPENATLTKALGHWEDLDVDILGGKINQGDIIILCSDGVYNMLSDEEIQAILLETGESKKACEWLIEGANSRGGVDNIVALISYINF